VAVLPITLPLRQRTSIGNRKKLPIPYVPHKRTAIAYKLNNLAPVCIELVKDKEHLGLFKCLLSQYHYLGFSGTAGEEYEIPGL